MIVLQDIPLAPFTTLRVGGPARYFIEAKSIEEVRKAVQFSVSQNLPLFVLGGGSNLVISDAGFPGLVLKIAIGGIDDGDHAQDGKMLFEVGAGESCSDARAICPQTTRPVAVLREVPLDYPKAEAQRSRSAAAEGGASERRHCPRCLSQARPVARFGARAPTGRRARTPSRGGFSRRR